MSSNRHIGNHCHCGDFYCTHNHAVVTAPRRRVHIVGRRSQRGVARPNLSGLSGWVARKLLDIEVVNDPRSLHEHLGPCSLKGCTHFYNPGGGMSPTQPSFYCSHHNTPSASPTRQLFSSLPARLTHHTPCPSSPTRQTHWGHSPPSSPTQLVHPSSSAYPIHPSSPKAYLLKNNLPAWIPPKHIVVNKDVWEAGGKVPLVTDIRADPLRWTKIGKEAEVLDIVGDAQSTGLLDSTRCKGHCPVPEPLPKLHYIRSVGPVAYGKPGATNVVFNLGRRMVTPITVLCGWKRLVISLHGTGWSFPDIHLRRGAKLDELVVIVTPRTTPEFKDALDDDDIRWLMNPSKWNAGKGTAITLRNLKHFSEQVRPLLDVGTKLILVNLNMAGRVPDSCNWDLSARKDWRQRRILDALKYKQCFDSVVFKTGGEYSNIVGKRRYELEIVPSKELIEGHMSWWSHWRQ